MWGVLSPQASPGLEAQVLLFPDLQTYQKALSRALLPPCRLAEGEAGCGSHTEYHPEERAVYVTGIGVGPRGTRFALLLLLSQPSGLPAFTIFAVAWQDDT